jgi:hypothetical protein
MNFQLYVAKKNVNLRPLGRLVLSAEIVAAIEKHNDRMMLRG